MSMFRKLFSVIAVLGLAVFLSGCNELADDTYGAVFTNRGKFQVYYSGSVDIELDQGEVIHLYSVGQQAANIKVVGKFHFAVHGCATVKADQGATVTAYNCNTVKAMPGTTVVTYNTPNVKAAKAVGVEVHGRTKIERYDYNNDSTSAAGTEDAGN